MSRVLIICLAAPLALALSACGGRPHLAEDVGSSYKRTFRAQTEAEPRRALASLGADEAKGIMDNHRAVYHPNSDKAGSAGQAGGGAGAGLLTPMIGGFLGGGDTNNNPIKLQAK